jgi:hypothetical protein
VTHCFCPVHDAHAAPPVPQLCFAVPALHEPSAAQQPEQVFGSHTHEPFAAQRWPT